MNGSQPQLIFDPPPRESHTAKILAELKKGRALTKWIIIHEIGCLNGGGRLSELRNGKYDGVRYPIKTEMIEVPNSNARVAKYVLRGDEENNVHLPVSECLAAPKASEKVECGL